MAREIKQHACRVPITGGAIFKYPYMSKWKLDVTVNGERLRPTLARDQRESLRMAHELLEAKRRLGRRGTEGAVDELTIRHVVDLYLAARCSDLPEELRDEPRADITYRNDDDRLNLIVERLPVEKVSDLRKSHCLEFIKARMTDQLKTNDELKVSRTTATKPVRLLLSALNFAVSQDYLVVNPLLGIKVPKTRAGEIRKIRRSMTIDEYVRFKTAAVEMDMARRAKQAGRFLPQAPLYFAIYESGRRLDEMLSLNWADVYLDGESPHWNFWNTKGQKLSAVSDSEPESYPIPPTVAEYIKALKGMHERHLGRPVGKDDCVFLGPEFGEMNDSNARKRFYAILATAKIDRADHRGRTLDLHAARTTVYARGAEAGIPVDQMMEFVGHRDIRTAMKHYRDPKATNKRRIAEKLAGLI
jgi:integrase